MSDTLSAKTIKLGDPSSQERVELTNGRIVDVINSRYHAQGTSIVVQGDKIVSMPGAAGEPTVPADATIDLQGKAVLPGLFNTHIHGPGSSPAAAVGLADMLRARRYGDAQIVKNLADCLDHGVTNVRHAGLVADLRVNWALKERIQRGDLAGPRITQAVVVGPAGSYMQEKLPLFMKVAGLAQVDPSEDYAGAVAFPIDATERQVRDAVDIAIDERGAEVIKIGDQSPSMISGQPVPLMTIEQLCALVDQARRRGVRSMMHHSTVESFRRGLKAGVPTMVHVPMDARLTRDDLEAFAATGTLLDPTVSAFYGLFSWKLSGTGSNSHPDLDRMTAFRERTYTFDTVAEEFYIPELQPVVTRGYNTCTNGKPKMMGIVDASGMIAWDSKAAYAFENFRLLYKQGIPMAAGNDTQPPCTPAMVGLELQMMDHVLDGVGNGRPFRPVDALRIATINSARSLGMEEEFGSIESGKTADLVILDGDPLRDISAIGSRVAALFMNGKLVINNCALEARSSGKAQNS